ncbi:MAG: hypothetical protein IVW53_05365 [Chloroflexi bacterium]|nr:hypothetical protein [Chloroflexota bacterium]
MGRRSKATETRIEALLSALRAGSTREGAAGHAGIDRTTLYRWLAGDARLRARVEQAEADFEVRSVAQIAQAAADDWRASAWLLERRRSASYGRSQMQAAAAAGASTVAPPHPLDDLSPAEGARLAREWAERLAAEAAAPVLVDGEITPA